MWPLKKIFKTHIQCEVQIDAPIELVWEILTDFENYEMWNPHIYLLRRHPHSPHTVYVHLHWPGLSPSNYKLQITEKIDFDSIRWQGQFMLPKLLDGYNHYKLIRISESQTKVVHREDFFGLLVPLFMPWLKSSVLRGFLNIDEALKIRATHLFRETF